MIKEEFEKLWQDYDEVSIDDYIPAIYKAANYFYLAGRADERKRCVEIIRNIPCKSDWSAYDMEMESILAIEEGKG